MSATKQPPVSTGGAAASGAGGDGGGDDRRRFPPLKTHYKEAKTGEMFRALKTAGVRSSHTSCLRCLQRATDSHKRNWLTCSRECPWCGSTTAHPGKPCPIVMARANTDFWMSHAGLTNEEVRSLSRGEPAGQRNSHGGQGRSSMSSGEPNSSSRGGSFDFNSYTPAPAGYQPAASYPPPPPAFEYGGDGYQYSSPYGGYLPPPPPPPPPHSSPYGYGPSQPPAAEAGGRRGGQRGGQRGGRRSHNERSDRRNRRDRALFTQSGEYRPSGINVLRDTIRTRLTEEESKAESEPEEKEDVQTVDAGENGVKIENDQDQNTAAGEGSTAPTDPVAVIQRQIQELAGRASEMPADEFARQMYQLTSSLTALQKWQ
ncbi:hypothetical protein DM02DRAFT_708873 [Periconia macrospinosa]|uniref:Uncharacterized protein n=1 Tax=Periconia macrospinosa TaxID=97972 RepID=A0A2V1CYN7_9PLEO|nr:hypothetical protein DM02DRAFT_708873 [Periconia macrospinosa]